jgi:polyhydroxyalkanoate synthesis regulator phasin
MASGLKEKITEELQQAKGVGKLRSDRIREIIAAAFSQMQTEIKTGSSELREIIRDAFSASLGAVQESGSEVKENLTASIEGILDGISQSRRKNIAETEAEVKRLQAQLTEQEDALEQELESGLQSIQEAGKEAPERIQAQLQDAIATIQNSEEAALLKKRYAQLQAQLSLLRANLATRSGPYYDQAQHHLEEARGWYRRMRPQAEASKDEADQKFAQMEQRIGEAGAALARREKQVRQLLSDLLHQATTDKESENRATQPTDSLPSSEK